MNERRERTVNADDAYAKHLQTGKRMQSMRPMTCSCHQHRTVKPLHYKG